MKRWPFYLVGMILLLAFAQNYHASAPAAAQPTTSLARLWSSLGTYATTLPQGVTPAMPYVQETWNDAESADIPPGYFVRQIQVESGFDPNAVSPAGAVGIAQFMITTAKEVGLTDRLDPHASLQAAALLMAQYYWHYHSYAKALAAYNAGAPTVDLALTKGGDHWYWYVPAVTQTYIRIITGQEVG